VGTGGADTMYGTDDDVGYGDWIVGREGNDRIYGLGGDDTDRAAHGGGLFGGRGEDLVRGGDGHDEVSGGGGSDSLYGGRGEDFVYGDGTFETNASAGDLLVGGPGDDKLQARDGQKVRGYCGTGFDVVEADDASESWPEDSGVRDLVDDSCEDVFRY
jgi:Ca2+-binding RTX toxin-like protein